MKLPKRKIEKCFSFDNEDGLSTYDIALLFSKKPKAISLKSRAIIDELRAA